MHSADSNKILFFCCCFVFFLVRHHFVNSIVGFEQSDYKAMLSLFAENIDFQSKTNVRDVG